ncbi:MAG: hypothetical protein LBK52_00300 [Deltaproteobacteria bacterium]|jgi:hypothetical protein|nr:hypothetical protein [Deltaproteobacteria bacterium]
MPHQIIHSISLSRSQILETGRVEIISNFILLSSLIRQEFPGSRVVLAEPVKNLKQDRINWFSNVESFCEPLGNLPPNQKAECEADIKEFVDFVLKLSIKLGNTNSLKQKKNSDLLAKIFVKPNCCEYYLADGQILAAGWGMKSIVSLPIIYEEAEPAPRPPEPEPEPAALPEPGPAPEPVPEPVPQPLILQRPYEKWSWAGFFKKAALGVLLGMVLGFAAVRFHFPRVYPALGALIRAKEFDVSRFDSNEEKLGLERADLQKVSEDYRSRRSACLIFSHDEVLAKDFSYLNGCWNVLGTKFYNTFDGRMTSFGFCWPGEKDQAQVNLTPQETGEPCQNPAAAAYDEEDLLLTGGEGRCPGSQDSYPQLDIRCTYSPDGAQAACKLIQHDDFSSVYPVEFRKSTEVPKK